MKTQLGIWCGLCALTLFGVGCAQGSISESSITTVSPTETEGLAHGCDTVLDSADDQDLSFARIAGNEVAILVDAPEGSCVDERDHVLDLLSVQQRFDLVAHIAAGFDEADPSPHPDLNGGVMADPSPHPDKPNGAASADPSPHPDKPTDDDDDGFAVVLVIQIGGGGGGGGTTGGAAPPPPPPRTPGKDD